MDVETTGLSSSRGDRVCEIALARWRQGCEPVTFASLVNPCRAISPGAFAVNGITDEMVRDAPGFSTVAPQVVGLLRGAALVAHNAPFDVAFLHAEMKAAKLVAPPCPVVDTLLLARRTFSFRSNSLGAVAAGLGIRPTGEHRALHDVLTTLAILKVILASAAERSLATLEDLLKFQRGIPAKIPVESPAWNLLPVLEEALAGNGTVRITYHSNQGGRTSRIVRPLQLSEFGAHRYLVAYCFLRQEERTFRLDRILSAERA